MGTILSLSADGQRLATSIPYGANGAGRARVYRYDADDNEWKKVGGDVLGEGDTSSLTYARLSADGNTLVVGAQLDDTIGENAGSARIFRFDATEDEWKQIGQSLYGEAAGSRFGTYPHTSRDGQTVAISELSFPPRSHIYSYDTDKDEWIQDGEDFENMTCMSLSPDGKKAIMCSVLLNVCQSYRFDDNSKLWNEMATFDADQFIPLAFSACRSGDGPKLCGIGKIADRNEEEEEEEATTIGFSPFALP